MVSWSTYCIFWVAEDQAKCRMELDVHNTHNMSIQYSNRFAGYIWVPHSHTVICTSCHQNILGFTVVKTLNALWNSKALLGVSTHKAIFGPFWLVRFSHSFDHKINRQRDLQYMRVPRGGGSYLIFLTNLTSYLIFAVLLKNSSVGNQGKWPICIYRQISFSKSD